MSDTRYSYEKINVVKIVVESPDGKVLLVKEPETNEWMPGRWGFPGGKVLEKESLYEAFKRKSIDDLNIQLEPLGLYKVVELLLEEKTVLMFHMVSKLKKDMNIRGEIADCQWVNREDVGSMEIVEFTEYYNKDLLLDYFNGKGKLMSLDFVESRFYYKLGADKHFNKWLKFDKND